MNETFQPEATANASTDSPPNHIEAGNGIAHDSHVVVAAPNIDILATAPKKAFSPYFGSSIGPAEQTVIPMGIYKESDKVTKNFCTEAKTSTAAVVDVFNQIEVFPLAEGARLNVRFITTLDILATSIEGTEWRKYIEGVTPLAGCGVPELEGMCIINLGRNHQARVFDEANFNKLLSGAQEIYEKGNGTPHGHDLPDGYTYTSFDCNSAFELKRKVIYMLVSFAWDKDEARAIVESPDVKFGLIIDQATGDVASLIGIESRQMSVYLDGKSVPLKAWEVAEAKTDPSHTGKGLYGYVNTEIMNRSVASGDVPDFVTGDANLHSPGHAVIKNAFIIQKRRCGLMDPTIRAKLSLPSTSALRADFTIRGSGARSEDELPDTQANSLLPTYQTRKMILETYDGNHK